MDRLSKINIDPAWRAELLKPSQIFTQKIGDPAEVIALTSDGEQYAEPISQFLNMFAKKARGLNDKQLDYMDALFGAFFAELKKVSEEGFRVERTGRIQYRDV